ncbi:MAG: hypothetical protein EU539_07485 [Promethearchaeota archaeon]|nr:MAG: hypothetical protein EU539_07485 [Candidatus Lokiarchaeota archaeon]
MTYTISLFYVFISVGLILNIIYDALKTNPIVFILYNITVFLILFGQIFFVLFNFFLYKIDSKIDKKKLITFLIIYTALIIMILLIPSGFKINEETNWRPVWSWDFLIIVYVFMFCFTIIPFLILFIRIYKSFNEKRLKVKLIYFFLGFIGFAIATYGAMLYNTWNEPIFRTIWTYLSLFIIIPSGLLTYYGIAASWKD